MHKKKYCATSYGNDEQMLQNHGFDSWPNQDELARYIMDTNDRIDAICEAFGYRTVQDIRGRWHVESLKDVIIYD